MAGRKRVAEALRSAREKQGLSLDQAAAGAGMPVQYVRVLEGEELGATIPDELYLIPYFRRYAESLGLDVMALLPEFLGTLQEAKAEPRRPVEISYESPLTKLWRPAAIVATIAVAAIVLWRSTPERPAVEPGTPIVEQVPDPEEPPVGAAPPVAAAPDDAFAPPDEAASPVPSPGALAPDASPPAIARAIVGSEDTGATATAEEPAAPARADPEPSPEATAGAMTARADTPRAADPPPAAPPRTEGPALPPGEGRELRVVASDETWLSLGIDGEPRESYLLQPGEIRSWRARTTFSLTVGNAGGISVALDGKTLPALGQSGEVVRLQLPERPGNNDG